MKLKRITALLGILIPGLAAGWWIGANVSLFPRLSAFGKSLGDGRELRAALSGVEARERAYSLGFQQAQQENQQLTESNRILRDSNSRIAEDSSGSVD